jgi:hypothetical protein
VVAPLHDVSASIEHLRRVALTLSARSG